MGKLPFDKDLKEDYRDKTDSENLDSFDCDCCGEETIGDTYQDREGQQFVCGECFDLSNDGTYFIETEPDPVSEVLKLGGVESEDGE